MYARMKLLLEWMLISFLLILTCKITGWFPFVPWWFVTVPLWLPPVLLLVAASVAFLAAIIALIASRPPGTPWRKRHDRHGPR